MMMFRTMKVAVVLTLMGVLTLFLCGFRDIHENKDTPCDFEARILEFMDDHPGIVVEKIPASDAAEKHVVVVINEETRYASTDRHIDLADLEVGMTIHIEGYEWFRGKSAKEVTVILAETIHPTAH
jgi:hypothetical protein